MIHVRDRAHNRSSWMLSPETRERWEAVLKPLATAIERNMGLMLAADVLGDLVAGEPCDESRALACCLCVPPRVILINRGVLANTNVECDQCRRPFRAVEGSDDEM